MVTAYHASPSRANIYPGVCECDATTVPLLGEGEGLLFNWRVFISREGRGWRIPSRPMNVQSGRQASEDVLDVDELATHAAGGRDGGSMAQKGVFKERLLLQVISVATQVAISRRVERYKLSLRGRQQEEGRRAGLASNTSTPMIWGWSVDAL